MNKINDWNLIAKNLQQQLQQEPTSKDIQQKMLEECFDDKNKRYCSEEK